jgi:hypothetical protein
MSINDFNRKVAPYIEDHELFSFNCTRLRNCEVINDPFILYPITLGSYLILLLIWIYSLKKSSTEVVSGQRLLSLLFGIKIYGDVSVFYFMLNCTPSEPLSSFGFLLYDTNNFVRPVFEAVLIYYLLSLSAVYLSYYFREFGFLEKKLVDAPNYLSTS